MQEAKYYEVPHRLVKNFVGREDILSQIDQHFTPTDRPKGLVLHALGGQGKSQIALKYCDESMETHRAIFWINASSKVTCTEAFEQIADTLDKSSSRTLGSPEKMVKHVVELLGERKTCSILVFDNYDSPDVFDDIEVFFPRSMYFESNFIFKFKTDEHARWTVEIFDHKPKPGLGRAWEVYRNSSYAR